MTKPKYKHPPIIEAVCELRLPSDSKWGMSSYIAFAQKAEQNGFGKVIDVNEGFQVQLALGPNAKPFVTPVSRRLQTWNKDENELWQASPDLFAANRREPYQGWEKFRPHILKGWDIYTKIARPKKAEQLTLHYVNRIEFSDDESPSDFVQFVPPDIQYGDLFETFTCQTQQSLRNGDRITVAAGVDATSENGRAVMLNIIYAKRLPSLEKTTLRSQIEFGHEKIIESFEKTITDTLRERMVKS